LTEQLARAAGEVLRRARRAEGLTLHGVWSRSGGRFKPSALGGYERGERSISLERFVALAEIYGVPADKLLAEVMEHLSPSGRAPVVIDLNALAALGDESEDLSGEARIVGEFVHSIRARRGDYLTSVVSLRSGDIDALSRALGISSSQLLERFQAALDERMQ
jgi:transcriptional regulator with XRE-family HTH domain